MLRLDWCTHEAAKYAVERWHYSGSLPGADTVRIGVWERGVFIGTVIFARGASPEIGRKFSVKFEQIAELARVALRAHESPVSRIVAIAVRMLRSICPKLRVLISFADPEHGHHGGIYQALGWVYTGLSAPTKLYFIGGRWRHTRSVAGTDRSPRNRMEFKSGVAPVKTVPGKHRYLLPLDGEIRARVAPLAKPYPKRDPADCAGKSSPAGPTGGEGGAVPTPALQGR